MTFFYNLNKRLAGITQLNESTSKPDFLDIDKDGDKKEAMKKAAQDKANKIKEEHGDMEEGNEFSGELVKARAQGAKTFKVDGKEYQVTESGDVMDEESMTEKFDTEVKLDPKKKGMFKGKTKAELESQLAKLKKSGPHEKGSAAFTKMKQLQFAIRAKSDWGKVSEEASGTDFAAATAEKKVKLKTDRGVEPGTDLDEGQMKQAMHLDAERMSLAKFCDKYGDEDWVKEFWNNVSGDIDESKLDEGSMKDAMFKDAERMSIEKFVAKYGDESWVREFYNNIMGDIDEETQSKTDDALHDFYKKQKAEKMKRLSGKRDYYESDEGRPYVVVHARKGQTEVTASSSYEAAKKAAAKWGLKNTAGVDAYLADVKHTPVDEDARPVEYNDDKPAYNGMTFESVTRKHFQQVADLLTNIENMEKRRELAQHHADIFATQNPRFSKEKFFKAVGLDTVAEDMKVGDTRKSSTGGTIKKLKGGVSHTSKEYDPDEEEVVDAPKRKRGGQSKDFGKKEYSFPKDEKALDAHKKQAKGKVHTMKEAEPKKVKEQAKSYPSDVPTVGAADSVSTPGINYGEGVYESLSLQLESLIKLNEGRDYPHPSTVRDDERVQPKYFGENDMEETTINVGDQIVDLLKNAGLISGDHQSSQEQPSEVCGGCNCAPCECGSENDQEEVVAFELSEEDVTVSLNQPDYPTNGEESDDALQYSGGLNGPKSTGQTTVPVIASQLRRQATMEDVAEADSFFSLYKSFKNLNK